MIPPTAMTPDRIDARDAGARAAFARGAQGQLRVDPQGNVQPMPIAIPNFVAGSPADGDVGAGVAQVITNNLKRSGLFAPIDQAAFIEKITNIDARRASRTGR